MVWDYKPLHCVCTPQHLVLLNIHFSQPARSVNAPQRPHRRRSLEYGRTTYPICPHYTFRAGAGLEYGRPILHAGVFDCSILHVLRAGRSIHTGHAVRKQGGDLLLFDPICPHCTFRAGAGLESGQPILHAASIVPYYTFFRPGRSIHTDHAVRNMGGGTVGDIRRNR